MGRHVLKTPVRTPQANAFCERLIGTMRRECLDWLIPISCTMNIAWRVTRRERRQMLSCMNLRITGGLNKNQAAATDERRERNRLLRTMLSAARGGAPR
jgi:transposase InsO family protein